MTEREVERKTIINASSFHPEIMKSEDNRMKRRQKQLAIYRPNSLLFVSFRCSVLFLPLQRR